MKRVIRLFVVASVLAVLVVATPAAAMVSLTM
jgi:hypothetical protein